MDWIGENPILFALGFLVVIAVIATVFGIELPDCKSSREEGAIGDSDAGDGGDGGGD